MKEEILFAGFGGQGIMFMGKAIAYAAMKEGKHVTWIPSYGAEVRGGTAYSMVKISDREIASPIVASPNRLIVMNMPSLFCVAIIFLTYKFVLPTLPSRKRKFLVRQAELGQSSCLRSQADKVSLPSEPSFAFMRVTV